MAQARVPGVSVSQVARRYDVNANLVFKWLRDPRFKVEDEAACRFLPVEVVAEATPSCTEQRPPESRIEIALANGHRLTVSGPFDADAVCRLVRGLSA
ncbi:MAG: transposase [Alphaproteobacteria bacterium]